MEPTDTTAEKLYSPGQIALAAFLGSPIAAFWLISRNYRKLDQPRAATLWFAWGIAGTVAMIAAFWTLPNGFPRQIITFAYTLGFFCTADQLWSDTIETHLAANGKLASWWAVVGISLLFLTAILALSIGAFELSHFLPDEYL
jgi:hypothetical protein